MTTTQTASTKQAASTAATGGANRQYGVSSAQGVWLVAKREVLTEIRQKSFIVSLIITVALVVGMVLLSNFMMKGGFDGGPQKVAVTEQAATLLPEALPTESFTTIPVADAAAGADLVTKEEAKALLTTREEAQQLTLFGPDAQPATPDGTSELVIVAASGDSSSLARAASVTPKTYQLNAEADDSGIRYGLGFLFGITFFMGAMTYCLRIAQSVVEEKSSRVVEILLATVSPRVIMAGKILGNSLLAFGQMLVIGIAASLAMIAMGQSAVLLTVLPAILAFAGYFVLGFLMLATLYAGAAALVSRQEEVASVTTPLMMLIMIPYFAIIMFNDNDVVLRAMSFIPFSSPIAMPIRLIIGDAMWWEAILALVILLATTAVCVWIGGRLYQNSILRTGGRVKVAEALKRQ